MGCLDRVYLPVVKGQNRLKMTPVLYYTILYYIGSCTDHLVGDPVGDVGNIVAYNVGEL